MSQRECEQCRGVGHHVDYDASLRGPIGETVTVTCETCEGEGEYEIEDDDMDSMVDQ